MASRFARLALDCVHREFPNHPLTVMSDPEDVRRPRDQTPAFFGCFDWHSAVHGHWTLVRLARLLPDAFWADEAIAALRQSLTPEKLQLELKFVSKPGREGFERPYGLAWLLQLATELREWDRAGVTNHSGPWEGEAPAEPNLTIPADSTLAAQRELRPPVAIHGVEAAARELSSAIRPLAEHCRNRLAEWLPKLTHPIRSGEHSQTAFAMGLAFDWAVGASDSEFAELLRRRSLDFYRDDADLPLRFEPSGHDFLSPSLAEADLMRRVLPQGEFALWLGTALPFDEASGGRQPPEILSVTVDRTLGADAPRSPLSPVAAADRADGKLAHLDGLNLSRAWMLDGIASALDDGDPRKATLERQATEHAAAGLASVTGENYAGGHWLGTFATYLMTARGTQSRCGISDSSKPLISDEV